MRRLALTALISLVLTTSLAEARPNTRDMTCAQAAALVRRAGAIVLSTGVHTYDRFVANGSFCIPGQDTKTATVPTDDTRYCYVGYTCIERDRLYRDY